MRKESLYRLKKIKKKKEKRRKKTRKKKSKEGRQQEGQEEQSVQGEEEREDGRKAEVQMSPDFYFIQYLLFQTCTFQFAWFPIHL